MSDNVQRLTASDVRQDFSNLVSRVAFRDERFIIRRGKEDMAALIPIGEYRRLLELTKIEDSNDETAHAG